MSANVTTTHNAVAYNAAAALLAGATLQPGFAPVVLVWFTPASSYDGTVTFQVSPDGEATWFTIDGRESSTIETPINAVTSPAVNKLYIIPVPSGCFFRALMSGGTQGSLTVEATPAHFINW